MVEIVLPAVSYLGPLIDDRPIAATAKRLADCWETAAIRTRIEAFLRKT